MVWYGCMYVCMCVCMCMYVCMHVCMYVGMVWYGMYVCIYVFYVCMYIYISMSQHGSNLNILSQHGITSIKLGARDAVVVAPPTAGAVVEALACAAYSIKMIWQCVKTLYPW